ncbi:MAG: hypothetical protein K2P01_06595 [Oscillospiraceae bacterium]|jgi:hypothetical protein|nr:hypothetical protein [Oscillospiraceae bacterium]
MAIWMAVLDEAATYIGIQVNDYLLFSAAFSAEIPAKGAENENFAIIETTH